VNKFILVMRDEIIKKILREATSSQSKGSYTSSLSFGYKDFDKHLTAPFTEFVNNFDDPMLDHDALDGKMSYSREFIKKREKRAERQAKAIKNNPDKVLQDNDGGLLNGGSNKNTDAKPLKNFNPKKVTQMKLKENLEEDLGVWFGTKKKPKGSSQPKGPWVNICRKKEGGGHPPCGRPEATDKGYPKCRAAGVASKMTDAQKKSACAQKRRAEKTNPKSGTGNKPKMTSYKPKSKKNESMRELIIRVLNENFGKPY
jgi:hypothetical protein